jgi:hypothetical protein
METAIELIHCADFNYVKQQPLAAVRPAPAAKLLATENYVFSLLTFTLEIDNLNLASTAIYRFPLVR